MTRRISIFILLTIAFLLVVIFYIAPKYILGKLPLLPVQNTKNSTPTLSANEVERLNLQNLLQEEIDTLGASYNVSLYYKNLKSGYEVTIDPNRSWNPASTVKAYVVVEAFRQRDLGLINFDSRVTIKDGNVVPTELESSGYQPLRAGVKATIRELISAMIVQSDNTAYNTLLDVLDRRNITTALRKLGLDDTIVGEKLSLTSDQYAIDASIPGRQSNKTTASDFGQLFGLLYEGKIADSEEILAIFKQQKIDDAIPSLLPQHIEIAHKTGTLPPYYHDGGIIYKPNDPFILVVFTNTGSPDAIARIAKVAYYKTRDVLGASTVNIVEEYIQFIFNRFFGH
ncbi:MAG TPA: serine hydrolase [Candidatus Eisenbacteria bacterium]|nr:serine hydrolase [Candidatus Eisenbacteria bacterium]